METRWQRIMFLASEWSLIIAWMLVFGLIWRQSLLFIFFVLFPLGDAAQFTYIVSILLMTVLSVVVMTMMGTWIERRPTTHSLLRRWLVGWGWFGIITAIGYGIILLGINK
jgi:hypothetical protein